jgi:SPP1 family predicted phage head-tail adaptor
MAVTQAGQLTRRITIQKQTTSQDSLGGLLNTWTTAYSCWANIDVQRSQLLYSTAEFIEKVTHRITVRFTKSFVFAPNMRVTYLDAATNVTHTYNIEAILNPEQGNVWLTLLAYELDGSE